MSNSKNQPLYRVKFCTVIGQDENGKDKLSRAVELGAVWPRRDASKGAVLRLDIEPKDIRAGVVFLDPVEQGGYA